MYSAYFILRTKDTAISVYTICYGISPREAIHTFGLRLPRRLAMTHQFGDLPPPFHPCFAGGELPADRHITYAG
jgi:hypothetical protein